MKAARWDIHPRDAGLGRTLDPISRWSRLDLIERYNLAGTWILTGPAEQLSVFGPDMGCILDRSVEVAPNQWVTKQVVSGQMRTFDRTFEYDNEGRPQDVITLGFVEDNRPLWHRLCWPDPAHPLTAAISNFPVSHDVRTGARETIALAYIAANLGPDAPLASRAMAELLLPTSLGRGGTTTKKARMDVLGDLVATLFEDAGLRARIVHDESTGAPLLPLLLEEVPDVSADIIFGNSTAGRATGAVKTWSLSYQDGEATDAIGFSAGEQEARGASHLVNVEAETRWGGKREVLVDQRQTDDPSDIDDALIDRLTEGASPVSVEFAVAPGSDLVDRVDYDLGYRLGIELPSLPVPLSDNRMRERSTVVEAARPEDVSIVVGTPGAQTKRATTAEHKRLNKTLKRLALIERSR